MRKVEWRCPLRLACFTGENGSKHIGHRDNLSQTTAAGFQAYLASASLVEDMSAATI
jgi:hypothetical protein